MGFSSFFILSRRLSFQYYQFTICTFHFVEHVKSSLCFRISLLVAKNNNNMTNIFCCQRSRFLEYYSIQFLYANGRSSTGWLWRDSYLSRFIFPFALNSIDFNCSVDRKEPLTMRLHIASLYLSSSLRILQLKITSRN